MDESDTLHLSSLGLWPPNVTEGRYAHCNWCDRGVSGPANFCEMCGKPVYELPVISGGDWTIDGLYEEFCEYLGIEEMDPTHRDFPKFAKFMAERHPGYTGNEFIIWRAWEF